jgi:hypothetical protein
MLNVKQEYFYYLIKKQHNIVYIFPILFFSWKTIYCIIKKLSQNLRIIMIKINDKYTKYIKIKVYNTGCTTLTSYRLQRL